MAKSPETEHPIKAFGWAARDTSGVLSPFNFSRRYVALIQKREKNMEKYNLGLLLFTIYKEYIFPLFFWFAWVHF